ncbi:MAG: hypothetical protein DHS20C09_13380 [marine bacterium B5-7]|nr:MAG: hypothetical protein DHS20C09_13380 [marine bacterium B5-7]
MDSNHKSSRNERRNYYRTLNVQPDASLEIIKNNYRTLLQKLRLHPDLGGKHWNASIINEAYNILRHSEKRAEYDKKLLKQYGVRKLSQGHLEQSALNEPTNATCTKDLHGNQRNYYRLFNIQPDSPISIIKTSYITLSKKSTVPKELLNEAYRILGNPEKRALYDRLITRYPHPEAITKLNTGKQKQRSKSLDLSAYTGEELPHSKANIKPISNSYYQPVITQYCTFCKTPHEQSPSKDIAPLCGECNSPLFPPSKSFIDQQRRDIVRLTNNSKVQLYTYWPGKLNIGTVTDISPLGIQLISSIELAKDQIIKIDGEDFKAVGIVSHTNKNKSEMLKEDHTVGIQFLTVNFNKNKGQFFSETA